MPVGLNAPASLAAVAGIRIATATLGGRGRPRDDLTLFELAAGTSCAATFTRNAFCAAPVTVAREHLARAAPRYLLVNAGNANAGTGTRGIDDTKRCCAIVAGATGAPIESVLPFSTGVIGEPLPIERFEHAVPIATRRLGEDGWLDAAAAIVTTDLVPKGVSRSIDIGGRRAVVTGIAKGSGMIRPDMATMLAFVATDAGRRAGCAALDDARCGGGKLQSDHHRRRHVDERRLCARRDRGAGQFARRGRHAGVLHAGRGRSGT